METYMHNEDLVPAGLHERLFAPLDIIAYRRDRTFRSHAPKDRIRMVILPLYLRLPSL